MSDDLHHQDWRPRHSPWLIAAGVMLATFMQVPDRIPQNSEDSGVTVVIVEQKVREVLKIAHWVYVLRTGRISFAGPAEELSDEAKLREVYL
jgi:ABC-type branched-subunit amino acid transport system ATPase component